MATAGDQIELALGLIGQLAEEETPSAATAQLCLTAMNQMLESWSIEKLSIFCTIDQIFTWPANQVTQTLGPSGDFVGIRPVLLDDSTYFVGNNGLSFPVGLINQEQYNQIPVKTNSSNYPQVLYANMSFPNIEMTVYPLPTQDLEWHFVSVQELAQPALLSTVLSFPPGYLRAFNYNLACEIAPYFGVEPSRQVQKIAMVSKRDLKRINNPNDMMSMPYNLVATNYRFNIFTGNP